MWPVPSQALALNVTVIPNSQVNAIQVKFLTFINVVSVLINGFHIGRAPDIRIYYRVYCPGRQAQMRPQTYGTVLVCQQLISYDCVDGNTAANR
jgi:hypothetical protein